MAIVWRLICDAVHIHHAPHCTRSKHMVNEALGITNANGDKSSIKMGNSGTLALSMNVNIRRLSPDVPLPEYKTGGACAFDIAVLDGGVLQPNERALFRTGLVVQVPAQHVLVLASRSSNAKKGIQLSNGIGVIDGDYCGPNDELHLALHNIGNEPYTITPGERLAQGLFLPVTIASFHEPESWVGDDRGGFGTTG